VEEAVSIPPARHLEEPLSDTVSQMGEGGKTEADENWKSLLENKKENIFEAPVEARTTSVEEHERVESISLPSPSLPFPARIEEKMEDLELLRASEMNRDQEDQPGLLEAPLLDASAFEEASRLIQEISEKNEDKGRNRHPFRGSRNSGNRLRSIFRNTPILFALVSESAGEK